MMALSIVVVLDTNILVAAHFNRNSNSARLVAAVGTGRIRLVWNEAIRDEYRVTIGRIPMLNWSVVEELLTPESRSESVDLSETGLESIADRQDRKFAALARASRAILVTADRHLLSVRDQLDIVVRTPSELALEIDGD